MMESNNQVCNNPFLIAEYIFYLGEKKDFYIGPLKLQKFLWYCQIQYYTDYQKLLFAEEFEAWQYGPVLKSVWSNFKNHFDQDGVPCKLTSDKNNLFNNVQFQVDNEKIIKIIESVLQKKGLKSGAELSLEVHQQKPWLETRKNKCKIGADSCSEKISNRLIKENALQIKIMFLDDLNRNE